MNRPGPPHNPGLRELVAGKREWASSLTVEQAKAGSKGWHERGYLPHRDEPGLIQMVTFHVADSFPESLRSEWEALLKIENHDERRKQLQAYLDKGRGECPLRQPRLAQLIEGAFRFYHNRDYELRAWVVMPNHVHVLFTVGQKPMGQVVGDWKEYTAREANKLLKRRGQFWAADYWDTFMRNSNHELQARSYAERNPVKACLVSAAKDWSWSSARYRDEYGRLVLESHNATERGTSRPAAAPNQRPR
jgi:REP element-mobilizing transposase RayT